MIKRVSPNLAADVQIVHGESICELENSYGLTGAFREYDFQLGIMVSGCTENDIIFWNKSFSRLPENKQELDVFVDSFEAELVDMQTISDIKPGVYPFLLPPDLVMNSCLNVVEAGFSHTFLENKTSPLFGRLNEKILSPLFTLADKSEFLPFDIDGIPCEPKVFFENGLLKTLPVPLESARKLDLRPNGSLIGGPCSYASSLCLSPGQKSSQELLSGMEEGVLLLMSGDMVQGNLIGGNLSGTVQSAFHVRNGKICGRLKSRSLSFNFYEAFADRLLALSSDTERFGGTLYAEGPWALIDGVSVC
jgi:predicted Zn-dependent protease